MVYNGGLPHIDKMRALAGLVKSFPVTSSDLLKIAVAHKFSKSMQDFIKLLPKDGVFINADDLLGLTTDLETVIREERKTQPEISISP